MNLPTRHNRTVLYVWIIVLIWTLLSVLPATAKMYKFKKNGTWHFTDTPPEDMPEESQEIKTPTPQLKPHFNGGPLLLADYSTSNAIEKAVSGTVYLKTSIGSGSGFFISGQGHIITNKHVLRTNEKVSTATTKRLDQIENKFAQAEERLEYNRQRLQEYREDLDVLANRAQTEGSREVREYYAHEHAKELRKYNRLQAEHERREDGLEESRRKFDSKRANFDYSRAVADLAQTFTITLADKSEHPVRLITLSADHDLALLKLDGYRTPFLDPAPKQVAQGSPVYAIGSPIGLKNKVSSGVFSGFQDGFIQTNAHIYPGNSGGALVTGDGQVLGINTFKRITRKFEGLGFAIPIQTALAEFASHLPAN